MLHNARCKVKTVNLPQSEQQLCIQGSVQLGTTLAQLGMKCCKTEAIKSIDLSCHFGKHLRFLGHQILVEMNSGFVLGMDHMDQAMENSQQNFHL